jgi:hypothetical protein
LPKRRSFYIRNKKDLHKIIGTKNIPQLLLFLTGAAGTGKSEIIKELLIYAEAFCRNLGVPFNDHTIQVTAVSGVAATLIHGETLHSACCLSYNIQNINEKMVENFEDVRLLIIDEISMADSSNIRKLDQVLKKLKQDQDLKYGGVNIAFMGDFSQLPCISNVSIYQDFNLCQWHDWMTCYIKLDGMWRFKDDLAFGKTCMNFHDGVPTPADFDRINACLVTGKN